VKPGVSATVTLTIGTTLADAERSFVERTLERVDGNKAEAARFLGVDVKTVRAKLRG
jgi:DNA-binding NtrC family response regulator